MLILYFCQYHARFSGSIYMGGLGYDLPELVANPSSGPASSERKTQSSTRKQKTGILAKKAPQNKIITPQSGRIICALIPATVHDITIRRCGPFPSLR